MTIKTHVERLVDARELLSTLYKIYEGKSQLDIIVFPWSYPPGILNMADRLEEYYENIKEPEHNIIEYMCAVLQEMINQAEGADKLHCYVNDNVLYIGLEDDKLYKIAKISSVNPNKIVFTGTSEPVQKLNDNFLTYRIGNDNELSKVPPAQIA